MTTGRAIVVDVECSSHSACSITSAFSFRRSTTARRTVQTLIGSYVALSTSTRPTSRPRRWCPVCGADPSGSGGTREAIGVRWRPFSGAPGGTPPDRAASGGRERPQDAYLLHVGAHGRQPGGDVCVVLTTLEVDEEHVAAQALLARARFDAREVDAALCELG